MTFYTDIKAIFAKNDYGIAAPAHAQPIGESMFRPSVLKHAIKHVEEVRQKTDKPLVHIGFAGFFNFDLIVESKPDNAILCDINNNQALFWNEIFDMIENSQTSSIFMRRWADKLTKQDTSKAAVMTCKSGIQFICRTSPTDNYFQECKWLEEENYRFLRKMIKKKKVLAVTLSATDPAGAEKLSHYLAENNFEVGTIYASNISETMTPRIAPGMKSAVVKAKNKGDAYLDDVLNNTPLDQLIVYPVTGFYKEGSDEIPYKLFQKTLSNLTTEHTLTFDVPGTNVGERLRRPLIMHESKQPTIHER